MQAAQPLTGGTASYGKSGEIQCIEHTVPITGINMSSVDDAQGNNEHMQDNGGTSYDEVDEDELSPWDYALHHGLVANSFDSNPFCSEYLPSLPESLHIDLEDPPSTLSIGTLVCTWALNGHTTHERWDVDKESVEFLTSVLALSNKYSEGLDCIHTMKRFGELKVEEATLASDAELDLLKLKRRNVVTITTEDMQPFQLNDERDESLCWPSNLLRLPAETDRDISNEKLEVDLETMEYMKAVAAPHTLSDDEIMLTAIEDGKVRIWADISARHANRTEVYQPRRMTPPLLPLSPPLSLSGVPASAAHLELTSTPEDLATLEAADIEQRIMALDDVPLQEYAPSLDARDSNVDPTNIYSPLRTPVASSSSPSQRKRLRHLKAEVPLIPQDSEESPAKKAKAVSFTQVMHTMIPQPESDSSILDPQAANQDIDAFIVDYATPLAEPAIHQNQNEQLMEIDTTLRMAVPSIEEVELRIPWTATVYCNYESSKTDPGNTFLSQTKDDLLEGERSWSGVSKVERLLPWSPFPARLGKVELNETFNNGSSARYMAEMIFEGHIDIESLVVKPDGLKFLDNENDDDELEPMGIDDDNEEVRPVPSSIVPPSSQPLGQPEPPGVTASAPAESIPGRVDMQTLLQRRKQELITAKKPKQSETRHQTAAEGSPGPKTKGAISTEATKAGDFLDRGGLSAFMNLHGVSAQSAIYLTPRQQAAQPAVTVEPVTEELGGSKGSTRPLPAPELATMPKSTTIVVSSHMLLSRQIIRQVQCALPMLELIERDPMPQTSEKSQKQNNGQEADFSLSSSTGVIITTLQKVKQKPLPGQNSFFGVRERIASVALRYERLIVLVSGGRQPSIDDLSIAMPLDERDTGALSDLKGRAATVDSGVQVHYIEGGETALAKWIAACISRYTTSDDDTNLLQDETMWERFLRKAGMNPFAAQVLLAQLKLPDSQHDSESSSTLNVSIITSHGLAAFLQMTFDQRLERFGPVLGGDKLLRRASDVVDGGWMSAASHKVLNAF